MKKMRLDLGDLRVDSFEVPETGERMRGTVHGAQFSRRCGTFPELTEQCESQPPSDCMPTAEGRPSCRGYGSCDPAIFCYPTDLALTCDTE